MGGEKQIPLPMLVRRSGSPPHGRGKESKHVSCSATVGITPAWAGKRDSATVAAALSRDHPRVGGEKILQRDCPPVSGGSPPRRRGKGISYVLVSEELGITPAWAGKSLARELLLIVSRDYPRVGGEKLSQLAMGLVAQGSPPHGQGKVVCNHFAGIGDGITPA